MHGGEAKNEADDVQVERENNWILCMMYVEKRVGHFSDIGTFQLIT